jgi:hypothetical protein
MMLQGLLLSQQQCRIDGANKQKQCNNQTERDEMPTTTNMTMTAIN